MAFLFPVFHPVPSVALAVVLVAIPLAKFVFDKVAKSAHKNFDTLDVYYIHGEGV